MLRLSEQLRQLEIETQAQIMHRFDRQREGESSVYDDAFDPLELDRFSRLQQLSGSLAETVNDLVSVKDMLTGHQREFTDLLTQQARLADDLQDGLLRTRLVPFVQVVPRLQRLVRQTADSLGKQAQLEVKGPEVELDRTILDRLVAPLEHLLRNAVDHGLEEPETRLKNGKPALGLVTLALAREGNDAVISLSDDGRGMNLQAIRRKAINLGMLAEDTVLPDDALLQFILEPGFTTSEKVTQISGRGVGLDVVASEIKAANGAIGLESVAGQGARFTIRLPLTLAIIEAFLVSAGENIYAIPHSTVEAATRINRQTLLDIYRGDLEEFTLRDQRHRVVYLGGVLDPTQQPDLGERRWLPLLLIRLGEQRVALHVDSLIESQRILVKPLGPQLARVRWLSGGTILSDGRVALILDALALLRSGAVAGYRPNAAPVAAIKPQHCIMVVDDSLTVRRVTSRLLRRQNMEVLTAKDGVEALTLLDENRPDLLLLDVEMPRMDGYELARHIRRAEHLKDLPIIMITSRTSAKHREYAMALGVDRYLGKPYQESELLNEINSLLEERKNLLN
ncbi:hybrid sensor histidine kinase/response regulator [Chromatium okenii]|uniref:hybrid sensor histidine kinase/response regulator n=1 Tax=Chromatium okenii TaxID=61644 RepID=UPI001F5B7514|nr:response regulator [Chromatium okenii]